ncbi:hypothetical protein FHT76_005158 [Rhizobium sp. BK176]|nr:hypothetical protein [Rhizobium sp. BK399]MCS3744297.1 hypothetical protein [Rhizobium sp. BK661]MCS4093473.1 hypothetical protein [Rhizobium sp. BK176]
MSLRFHTRAMARRASRCCRALRSRHAKPRPFRITAAHHQIKFHVNQAGRFGYADLIEPDFIGAEKISILQRLKDAVKKAAPGSRFTPVT